MSYQANDFSVIDEQEEERIISQYEQERANEDILKIKNLNLNETSNKFSNKDVKFDKCLNLTDISDDEFLHNLNDLDNESLDNKINKPLFINQSIPLFTIENLNKAAKRKLKELNSLNLKEFNQLDNPLNNLLDLTLNDFTLNYENLLINSSNLSNGLLNNHQSTSNPSNSTSTNSSNDNLSVHNSSYNLKRKKINQIITFEIISAKSVSNLNISNKPFVIYTILIKRTPGLEVKPGIIEKRYTFNIKINL